MNYSTLLLAVYGDEPSPWPGRAIAAIAIILLISVPVLVVWARRRRTRRESAMFYEGIKGIRPSAECGPGEVRLVFHTYSGFLVFADQRKHDIVLPASEARILLRRLFKHNVTWGLLAYAGLLVPLVSCPEYLKQSKKIKKALREAGSS
jgi:hypothetical protein